MSNDLQIVREFLLPASLDDLWQCLADSDECSTWQGQECEIGSEIGAPISLFGGWVTGEIVEIVPHTKLSYTWKASEWSDDTPFSLVTYQLFKINEKETRVELDHRIFPSKIERDNHDKGWDDHFFGPLKTYLV